MPGHLQVAQGIEVSSDALTMRCAVRRAPVNSPLDVSQAHALMASRCHFCGAQKNNRFSKHSDAPMTGSDMVARHINLDDESFLERPMLTLFADLYSSDLSAPAQSTAGRKR